MGIDAQQVVDEGLLLPGREDERLAFVQTQADAVQRGGRGALQTGGTGDFGDAVDVELSFIEESALYPQGFVVDGVPGIDQGIDDKGGEDDQQGEPYPHRQVYHEGIDG